MITNKKNIIQFSSNRLAEIENYRGMNIVTGGDEIIISAREKTGANGKVHDIAVSDSTGKIIRYLTNRYDGNPFNNDRDNDIYP